MSKPGHLFMSKAKNEKRLYLGKEELIPISRTEISRRHLSFLLRKYSTFALLKTQKMNNQSKNIPGKNQISFITYNHVDILYIKSTKFISDS